MSVLNNSLLLSAPAGGAGGYTISRSLRFNSADSSFLSRTPASAGNRKTWTWAGWVKRSALTGTNYLFGAYYDGSNRYEYLAFDSSNQIEWFSGLYDINGTTVSGRKITTPVYRDASAWYHIVAVKDTTQATASDRFKLYVNGVQVSTFGTSTNPALNDESFINDSSTPHRVGGLVSTANSNQYLADIHFIDGQALDPTSFGEFSATTGVWMPKAFSGGSYGTNGFRLTFADNSAATATTLGKDAAGSNNWTPNNLSVTAGAGNDSLVDVPVNGSEVDTGLGGEVRGNCCTWGATYAGAAGLTNGNLDFLAPTTMNAFGSISFITGKWYWEITNSGTGLSYVGIMDSTILSAADTSWSTQARAYVSGGSKYDGSSTSYGASWAAGDVIGFALDLNANTLTFYKNGVSQGVAFSSGLIGKEWKPFVYGSSGSGCSANFGQRPFAYTAPSGFKALCTANLPAPVVTKPSTVMDVLLYTGDGASTKTVGGLQFSPDLVWLKCRSDARIHGLANTVVGANRFLSSNQNNAEYVNDAFGYLSAFTSDGFTLSAGSTNNGTFNGSHAYVAWCWDAGSSTVTNTAGSISSQVRANASAGFSIVTYTSNGTNGATIGHGLGIAPQFVVVKNRLNGTNWTVGHQFLDATSPWNYYLLLNSTNARAAASVFWNNTSPSSSVITLGTSTSVNSIDGDPYVAYCFAPVAGYSSFGSYTGNGSVDGSFVYTGMRSRWIMIKRTNTTSNWTIIDTAREGYNVDNDPLYPNLADAEGTTDLADILSNGFKLRSTDASVNASSGIYVYAAFSEAAFQHSRAR